LLQFEIVAEGNDVYLRRNEVGSIIFLLVWSGFVACFLALGLWIFSQILHRHDWMLYLVCSPFVLVPLGMLLFVGWVLPAQMITRVCFKMDERETRIRYLWFFQRTIREIPSRIQINGGGTLAVSATLLFAERRTRIPLFCSTRGIVNTQAEGMELGLEETAEIRELLKLTVETRQHLRSDGFDKPGAVVSAPSSVKKRELAELLAQAPPRNVPRDLSLPVPRAVIAFSVGMVLICLLFWWWFMPWGIWHDWQLDRSAAQARGRVVAVSDTGSAEGRHGRWPISEYDFKFTPAGGTEVNGVSYALPQRWKQRDRVTVQYLPGNPVVARIAGARTTVFGLPNPLGVLVPIFIISILAWAWLGRRRVKWMFKHGVAAEVRVVAVEETKKKMLFNGEFIYKISLQSTDDAGARTWVMRDWHEDTIKLARERYASGHTVFLLYIPGRPKRLLLPEAWLDW
jgi:hypothetical protein